MAEKTPWKAKRQPQQGDRPPVYTSLKATMNQGSTSRVSTSMKLGNVLGQDKEAMAPSSVVPLKRVMRQG